MPVIDFEEWKKRYAQSPPKRPAVVSFYGAFHADRTGNLRSLTISIMVDDGDWSELMENVMENGGVGGENDEGEPFFRACRKLFSLAVRLETEPSGTQIPAT